MNPEVILTPDELATRLKVKKSWIYERMRMGKPLPHYRMGKYLRFNWLEVSAWLERQHRRAA